MSDLIFYFAGIITATLAFFALRIRRVEIETLPPSTRSEIDYRQRITRLNVDDTRPMRKLPRADTSFSEDTQP
jgi:hypothetical protein